jgi:hypothetical protein
LSISMVDKKPILQAFQHASHISEDLPSSKQLDLWGIPIGH